MDHDGTVIERREISFVGRAQVSAPLEFVFELALSMAFLQFLDGFVVSDARERRVDFLELREVATDGLQVGAASIETSLNQKCQQAFGEFHQVVERAIGDFRFDHPEFGEMAASLRFFRAESWTERIDLAERHRRCFDVELAGLREVSLLFEVVHGEERGSSFAGSGREDGRIGKSESVAVEKIAGGANDFGAHAQDRGLALRAQPKMAVLH